MGILDYFRLLYHRRYYSKKHIEKYQLKDIKHMVEYARKHSPFYRRLYEGYSVESFEDFHKLPVINKQIMMDHFSELNTAGVDKDDVLAYAVDKEINKDYYGYYNDQFVVGLSSGTSGNKGIYLTPKSLTKRLPFVFLARSGLKLRKMPFRILFLLRVFSQGFEDINAPFVSLKYMSTMTAVDDIIEKINRDRINIIMAPPSLLRQVMPKAGYIETKIKQIVTYAEVLHEEDKRQFEEAFHTKVIEIYQASEGQMASACKHGHLHINEDLVYIEIYDDHNHMIKEDNVVGHKMMITNLVNKAQPLIRYEMNDMIVLDQACRCGSAFRRIKKVLGRHDDLLYFLDANNKQKVIYPDLFVRWIIVTSDLIREFQVVQNNINTLDITVDLLKQDDHVIDQLTDKLQKELVQYDIHHVKINISVQDIKLPEEKNKFKRFISHIAKN